MREFGSHDVQDGEDNDETTPLSRSKGTKKKVSLDKWSVDDDNVLCGAWFEHSTDCVVGTSQNTDVFWSKIMAEVNQYAKCNRSVESCKCRWSKISHDVGKYVGCESKATCHYSRCRSGSNQGDIKSWAMNLFTDENGGQQFLFFHCYDKCKDNPKFLAQYGPKESDGEEYMPRMSSMPRSSDDGSTMQYPSRSIGVKVAKCKARGKGKTMRRTIDDGQSIESKKMVFQSTIRDAVKSAEKVVENERKKMEYNIEQREFVRIQSEHEQKLANTRLLITLMQLQDLTTGQMALRDKLVVVVYNQY